MTKTATETKRRLKMPQLVPQLVLSVDANNETAYCKSSVAEESSRTPAIRRLCSGLENADGL